MSFTDALFLYLFLPVCAACCCLAKTRYRNAVLIGFSLLFYAWGEPVYLWLLLFGVCMNYVLGRLISYSGEQLAAKLSLTLALIMNVGLLFSFQYAGTLVESINMLSGAALPVPDPAMPLGLSFFTLRAVSYVMDCYRGRVCAEADFRKFLLYMILFPLALQGPAVRYDTVQMQLHTRTVRTADFSAGICRIVVGLGKKVLLADQLAPVADQFLFGSSPETQSALGTWYGALLFSLRIYFDLSGYVDIALGLGRIFGFRFEENFRHPFLSRSITGFWRNWHISLNDFFRDYVLRASICGKGKALSGILLAAAAGGIWHGAGWGFVLWGVFCGAFVMLEQALGEERLGKIPAVVGHLYSKLLAIICLGLLGAVRNGEPLVFLKNLFFLGEGGIADAAVGVSVQNNMLLIAAAVLCCFPLTERIKVRLQCCESQRTYAIVQTAGIVLTGAVLVLTSIFLGSEASLPFFYVYK
ncbi:MAG: MBOAT family protein [Ruminococcus sp.]|nr:MBOAT family protein [Ruminococcus sp.]